VGYNGSSFSEMEDMISVQALERYLEINHIELKEGRVYEINLDAIEWLKRVSEWLQKGFVLTIDYGDTIDGLQQGNDTDGMLRCFYKHTVNRDYYERLGEQDITTHVDFTSLMNAGESTGLKVTGFTKQSHYLIALGILKRLNMVSNDMNTILKVKNLFHPEGMGEVFKVLIQHKNIEDPRLTGLKPLHTVTV
jgi:SAM-dependent MidA family methyltransferase